jgi:hypothetical protein
MSCDRGVGARRRRRCVGCCGNSGRSDRSGAEQNGHGALLSGSDRHLLLASTKAIGGHFDCMTTGHHTNHAACVRGLSIYNHDGIADRRGLDANLDFAHLSAQLVDLCFDLRALTGGQSSGRCSLTQEALEVIERINGTTKVHVTIRNVDAHGVVRRDAIR